MSRYALPTSVNRKKKFLQQKTEIFLKNIQFNSREIKEGSRKDNWRRIEHNSSFAENLFFFFFWRRGGPTIDGRCPFGQRKRLRSAH